MSEPVHSEKTLGATPLFWKAVAAVGQRPALYVDFGKALRVAEASPHHPADAHFKRVLPRLSHIEFVAAGVRRDAALDIFRAVIGLR